VLTVTLAGLRARWRSSVLSALAIALGVAFVAATLINTNTVHAAYYSQFAAQAKNVDAEARDLHVAAGDEVTMAGHQLRVVATFSDSVLDEKALISWTGYTRLFGPGEDTQVLVKARPGVSTTASAAAVDEATAAYPLIDITSEASLRAHLTASIQKLATILDGLLATSVLIALFGMEAVLLALMGAVVGVAFGVGFGWATGRAFVRTDGGPVSYPVLEILGYVALAGVAGLLASVAPARRAARLSVIDGLAAELPAVRVGLPRGQRHEHREQDRAPPKRRHHRVCQWPGTPGGGGAEQRAAGRGGRADRVPVGDGPQPPRHPGRRNEHVAQHAHREHQDAGLGRDVLPSGQHAEERPRPHHRESQQQQQPERRECLADPIGRPPADQQPDARHGREHHGVHPEVGDGLPDLDGHPGDRHRVQPVGDPALQVPGRPDHGPHDPVHRDEHEQPRQQIVPVVRHVHRAAEHVPEHHQHQHRRPDRQPQQPRRVLVHLQRS
jgi:hypothetical protein